MEIIEDPLRQRPSIEEAILKYGYTPDHQFNWFLCCAEKQQPHVFSWDDGSKVLAYQDIAERTWMIFSDPVAPQEKRREIVHEIVRYLLQVDSNSRILFLDVRDEIRRYLEEMSDVTYLPEYTLTWPVLDMHQYNEVLPGGSFKTLRNARSGFYAHHTVEIKETRSLDAVALHGIVDRWNTNRERHGIEELYPDRYHLMIQSGFAGCLTARAMIVDGVPVGFNAGWEVPGTPDAFAAAIGIHDYSLKDLGIVLLLEDLLWIQKAGYRWCDLEGSDEGPALRFKMQFGPAHTYTTHTGRVVKK